MLTSMDGVSALRELRLELEDSAQQEFPHALLSELLMLYDVCKALGMSSRLTRDILGTDGWTCVHNHLEVRFSPR